MRKSLAVVLVAGLAGAAGAAAAVKAKQPRTLGPGAYTASIKALICSACGPKVMETMRGVRGVSGVSVDQRKSLLKFTVRKGAKLDVAGLQKRLKAASDAMGMGADYSLREITRAAARGGGEGAAKGAGGAMTGKKGTKM
ncbi:MAG: hypothetical protein KGL53_06910 [Elusimicrobia bacterium]|nr:hypothetical protein [Elusimicrobiota bacterium]